MTSAVNPEAYGPQGTGSPWGHGPNWQAHPWQWGPPWALHNLPRPFGIVAVVLGFILWWPVGLAILFYMIGSGRMGCRAFRRYGNNPGTPWQGGAPWAGWKNWCGGERTAQTSGNRAFDEYRAETLRRLEEEQKDFAAFLERLRFAKDKAEFDQFMTDRRQPPVPPDPTAQPTG
jgi:Protein of unknown function (DUF2852)